MAPLYIADDEWANFSMMLRTAKRMGIDAVSVDIWWGLVETEPGVFDWSYYDHVLACIESANLEWVPIMSFHACGPNVGDAYRQPVPAWAWSRLQQDLMVSSQTEVLPADLRYVSETGVPCDEYISHWVDEVAIPYYISFMKAFQRKYANKAYMTQEINISCGPAGELRYPSYNSHDGGGYPQQGFLQCYSRPAQRDFARWAESSYRQIVRLNQRWGTRFASFAEVCPPRSAAEAFRDPRSPYVLDFVSWYNDALIDHGQRMIAAAMKAFVGTTFASIPIGVKIPGVHWRIADAYTPRSAEICAGLIRAHDNNNAFSGYGYRRTLDRLIAKDLRDRVRLHFTCLEMGDAPAGAPDASRARSLVGWVGLSAHKLGINLKGENALAQGLLTEAGWKNIEHAVQAYHYTGLTTLRINEVTAGLGKEAYWRLIGTMKGLISEPKTHA